jgi:4-hydroxy-2-oxoheptanedioate aldolase
MRANAWMIQQALAAGVHGILLCNAESPEAARLMIEAGRYPFAPHVEGLAQGTRGNGSQLRFPHMGRGPPGIYAHR